MYRIESSLCFFGMHKDGIARLDWADGSNGVGEGKTLDLVFSVFNQFEYFY